MRQAHLGGRTKGLRPGQQRQLDRLSQRRHPEDSGADLLTLERLAKLVDELELSMHLVLDGRGLCRLLWLGPLTGSDNLREHLPSAPRRSSRAGGCGDFANRNGASVGHRSRRGGTRLNGSAPAEGVAAAYRRL